MLWDYIFTYISITRPPPHTYVYLLHTDSQMRGGVSFMHSGPAVTRTVLGWKDVDQHKYGSCPYSRKASVQLSSLSCVWLSVTPWTAAHQASLSIINFRSLFKLTSIESVMPSNHLILCQPLLLPPSIFPSISLSNESVLHIRWSKYRSWSFRISPSNEYSLRMWTGWISLLSEGLSNTTVQKHRFLGAQPSLWFNSHIHT